MAAKRSLPSWMSACVSGSSGKHQSSVVNRRKSGGQKRAERTMLYWMNERELAETALSVLLANTVEPDVACPVSDAEASVIPETDTDEESDLDAQERICGSKSNVDVAEQQTVPYITCIEKERSSVESDSADDQHYIHLRALGKDPELDDDSQGSKTDPEALQLVREIFFS